MRANREGQQGVALPRSWRAPSALPREDRLGDRTPDSAFGCSGLGEVGGQMMKHLPLFGMRRQQGRDRGEMECWETRAERLPAVK